MCGLVGVAGEIDAKIIKIFNDMMVFNITRGRDSSGVASVSRLSDAFDVFKMTVHASVLQEFKGYDRVVSTGRKVLIGHSRSATVGTVSVGNAHPFDFDKIVGAHNGTLPYNVKSDLPNHLSFGTDSEALFSSINDRGVVETIGSLTGGAYALSWFDKENNTINLLRNDERPLVFGLINDGKTLVWASEAYFIRAACDRHHMDHDKSLFILPVDRHYRWVVPNSVNNKFENPIVRPLERKERPVTYTGNYFRQGGYVGGTSSVVPLTVKPTPYTPPLISASKVPPRPLAVVKKTKHDNMIVGFNNQNLGRHAFKKKTGETCAFSDQVVTFDDIVRGEKVHFISPTQFVIEEYYTPELIQWFNLG
jgi:predicted glutamine amidotransferase